MKAYFQLFSTSKQQVVKKDGVVPVMGHITGRNTVTLETNRMLDKMRVHSNKHYQEIMEADYVIFLDTCGFLSLISELQYLTIS